MTATPPSRWRTHRPWAIPAIVILALAYPLLSDRTFASDWGNHLWLVPAQDADIPALGLPSYYLQSDLGPSRSPPSP